MNLPHRFEAGHKAKADEVNENFNAVATAIDELNENIINNRSSLQALVDTQIGTLENSLTTQIGTDKTELTNTLNTGLSTAKYTNILPDYSRGFTGISSGWVATYNGWVLWSKTGGDGSTAHMYINGQNVQDAYHYKYKNNFKFLLPFAKGNVITFDSASAWVVRCIGG